MSSDGNVANLMGLGRNALVGGNNAEALTYFNRVLEIDPALSEAWVGKGKAAGWQSSLVNIRLGETLIAFNHAIACANEESKSAVRHEAVLQVNNMSVGLYKLARQNLDQFAAADNVWANYLNQVSVLISALNGALEWDPTNQGTLENLVHLCKDNIEGYTFYNKFNNNAHTLFNISESYEALLRGHMNRANDVIRSIDPSYAAPVIEKKKVEACFVVTATLGDFNHPDVALLRKFRDAWILKRSGGEAFVRFYYKIGPLLAAIIERSDLLKTASYHLIVLPAVRFARRRIS